MTAATSSVKPTRDEGCDGDDLQAISDLIRKVLLK